MSVWHFLFKKQVLPGRFVVWTPAFVFVGVVLAVVLAPIYGDEAPSDAKPLAAWQPFADCFADRRGFERVPMYVVDRDVLRAGDTSAIAKDTAGAYYPARHEIAFIASSVDNLDEASDRHTVAHELLHADDGLHLFRLVYNMIEGHHHKSFYADLTGAVMELEGCMVDAGHPPLWMVNEHGYQVTIRDHFLSDCRWARFDAEDAIGVYQDPEVHWDACEAEWDARNQP